MDHGSFGVKYMDHGSCVRYMVPCFILVLWYKSRSLNCCSINKKNSNKFQRNALFD